MVIEEIASTSRKRTFISFSVSSLLYLLNICLIAFLCFPNKFMYVFKVKFNFLRTKLP